MVLERLDGAERISNDLFCPNDLFRLAAVNVAHAAIALHRPQNLILEVSALAARHTPGFDQEGL